MDLIGAISSAGQALQIVKQLREIEKGVESGAYRAQIADLYQSVAEVRMALTDAKEVIAERDREIARLRAEIEQSKSGEICPLCEEGRLKVVSVELDSIFGVFGHEEHTLRCQNPKCSHIAIRKVVPK